MQDNITDPDETLLVEEDESCDEGKCDQESVKPDDDGPEQFVDVVDVRADELIDSKNVVSIEMPKVTIDIVNKVPYIQKTPILLTLHDNPKVCSNLILAATKELKELVITTYMDEEKTIVSDVWELENARVKTINFGQIVTLPQPDQRVVQCEIEFSKLVINGVKI